MSRYLFVTGKLAAPSLDSCLREIPDLQYEIVILPISVAALMDLRFMEKHGQCERLRPGHDSGIVQMRS
jgi:hypothetical protein